MERLEDIVSEFPPWFLDELPPSPSQSELRRVDFAREADPIFFKWQRGEATEQDWLDKVAEIRERYPEPS